MNNSIFVVVVHNMLTHYIRKGVYFAGTRVHYSTYDIRYGKCGICIFVTLYLCMSCLTLQIVPLGKVWGNITVSELDAVSRYMPVYVIHIYSNYVSVPELFNRHLSPACNMGCTILIRQ